VTSERILLAGAALLLAVVAAVATQRLRLPVLITFLGLGMLLASEGSDSRWRDTQAPCTDRLRLPLSHRRFVE
jgi:Kef-type K+ transport system membrane component KefB